MKNFLNLLTGMVLTGILFTGCEAVDEPLNANDTEVNTITSDIPLDKISEPGLQPHFVEQLEDFENVLINDYVVEFLNRETKGTGENITTTFSYLVSGTNVTPSMDSFYLEIPDCTESLLSYTPKESAKVSEGMVKWNSSVTQNGSQEFSVTYKGDVPLGIVNSTVVRGSLVETGLVVGPCKGVYTLEGNIYIDSNESGDKQLSESGLTSTVKLLDKRKDKEYEISTSSNGFYSIMVLNGDYSISVDKDLLGDGNYILITNHSNTKDFDDVQQNFADQNFGFDANDSKMINDLENGEITVNTEPTKFWVNQIKHAGKKNSDYTVQEMNDLLTEVEGLFLEEPFQLGANKINSAMDILTRPIQSDLDLFLQQLLTAELNILSGRGAYDQNVENQIQEFNDALLIYSEAIACFEMGICTDGQISTEAVTTKASDSNLLLSFNGTGGVN